MKRANTPKKYRRKLTKEWIERMYFVEKHPVRFIAFMAGYDPKTLKKKMDEYGIKTRKGGWTSRLNYGGKSY